AVIRKADAGSIRCGDVVLFRRAEQLIVHRVVEKSGALDRETILTKGDSHRSADGAVTHDQLLGRIVRIYRNGHRIDLEAPGQLALALFLSQASLYNRFWFPAARFAAVATRPLRRVISSFAPPDEMAR